MAIISKDTFNALSGYVGVRLQQGVPIADADWNEQEDIRKFELRSFIKWFVGDGVPAGVLDSFKIEGTGASGDFLIHSGITGTADGLNNIGHILVDGLDVRMDKDLQFSKQPLHKSQDPKGDLAAAWGVDPLPELGTAVVDGSVTVYLDVWERLVTPSEDPGLVIPGLATETCARKRREWVVRVRDKANAPVDGEPDYKISHSYYALAKIKRTKGVAIIAASDITDVRRTGLSLGAVDPRLAARVAALEAWKTSTDTALGTYAKTTDLVDYVKNAELATVLADYVKQTALSSILADYVKNTTLITALSNYVKNAELATVLADYVKQTALSTILVDYVKNTAFTTTLADYVKGTVFTPAIDALTNRINALDKLKTPFIWSKSDYVPYASPPGVPISRTDLSKLDIPGGPKKVAAFISVSAIDDKGASGARFCMAYVSKVDGKDQPKLPVGIFGTSAPAVTDAKASSYVGTASSIEFAIENTAPCIYTAVVLQLGDP